MTFDDFWEIKGGGCTYDIGQYIWQAAQAAERERAKGLVDALNLAATVLDMYVQQRAQAECLRNVLDEYEGLRNES